MPRVMAQHDSCSRLALAGFSCYAAHRPKAQPGGHGITGTSACDLRLPPELSRGKLAATDDLEAIGTSASFGEDDVGQAMFLHQAIL